MASTLNVAAVRALEVAAISSRLEVSSAGRRGGLRFSDATRREVVLRSSPARSVVAMREGEGVGDKGKAENAFGDAGGFVKTTGSESRKNVGEDMKGKISWNRGQLAYVIVYVPDVNRSADFYSKAFGLEIRSQNKSNSWIEMETGATTLAFTPAKQHETELTGGVASSGNNNVVINLDFQDVEAAYKHAVAQGATPVARPEEKNWPQKVGYVKDIDENIVRLGSFPAM